MLVEAGRALQEAMKPKAMRDDFAKIPKLGVDAACELPATCFAEPWEDAELARVVAVVERRKAAALRKTCPVGHN